MMNHKRQNGLTMIEVLVAVTILALLAAGLFFVSGQTRTQANTQLVQSGLRILDAALEQYYEQTHTYPPDVNYAGAGNTRDMLAALDGGGTATGPFSNPLAGPAYVVNYTDAQSVEVLYYYLNRLPQSRQALGKLPDSFVTAKAVRPDAYGRPLASQISDPDVFVTINAKNIALMRITDVWNMPLRYTRHRTNISQETTNFPLIESAGPDKKFDTADDIANKKF